MMVHDQSLSVRVREMKQENHSQKMELNYERSLREVEIVCEAEKARQMRLKILMLEDANDDMMSQLAEDDARIEDLQATQEELQSQLEISTDDFERVRTDLRLRDREIEQLKAELRSLEGVSIDSSKLLTEKLTLSRELAVLKPELEHLRAQVSSDQTLLSEKLALQRQVSSLQVEVEQEKRAAQKAAAKEDARQAEDSKFELQVQSLQAELAKERRERQKAEAEAQKTSTDLETKNAVLESKLDAFRTKLKTTKDQLKDTQAAAQSRASAVSRISEARESAVGNPRKRSIAQVEFDATIGTPGDQPAPKRGKRASSALPGEKSTFSITPFLNRTTSVAPESPPSQQDDEVNQVGNENSSDAESEAHDTPSAKSTKAAFKKPQKPQALVPARAGKSNTRGRPKGAATRKASMPPTLDQVAEEGDEENAENAESEPVQAVKPKKSLPSVREESAEPTFIKKKRKILGGGSLGKTLFHDEDGEAGKGGEKGLFGAAKGIGAFGRKGVGLGGVKLGPKPGGVAAGFGSFSPLKKDRRPALV